MARPVAMRRTPSQSNTQQSGLAGGTLGGRPQAASKGRPGRRPVNLGDEVYLWILVVGEAILMGILRRQFRRRHGG